LNPTKQTSESFKTMLNKGKIEDIDEAVGAEPVKDELKNVAEDMISETNTKNVAKTAQIDAELKTKRE
jgi:hypothetical protein